MSRLDIDPYRFVIWPISCTNCSDPLDGIRTRHGFKWKSILVFQKDFHASKAKSIGIAEFVARHDEDVVTQQMDQALREMEAPYEEFSKEASRRVFRRAI